MTGPNNNAKGELRPTLIPAGSVVSGEEVDSSRTEDSNPLAAFFRTVLDELRKRLTPAEFAELLSQCDMDAKDIEDL